MKRCCIYTKNENILQTGLSSQFVFTIINVLIAVNLDNDARNGYIFTTDSEVHLPISTRIPICHDFRAGNRIIRRYSAGTSVRSAACCMPLNCVTHLMRHENRPLVDMYETGDEIVLEFDLPGFRLEEISLTVCGLTLVLEAQQAAGGRTRPVSYVLNAATVTFTTPYIFPAASIRAPSRQSTGAECCG